jgi:hypothetical protein
MHSICQSQTDQNLLLGLFLITELSSSFSNNSLLLSLTGSLGLRTLGIHLLFDDSLTRLLGLGLVDLFPISAHKFQESLVRITYMLNQCSLMLEGVTLAQVVELVVEVFVNLAAGTIFD